MTSRSGGQPVVDRILDSMADGVLVIDRGGRIVTWNTAAGRILGQADRRVEGASLAETFLLVEGLDAFSQAVLDAVDSEEEMGRRMVEVEIEGEGRSLALTTTYLRSGAPARHEGAIVAVFSDLTEVTALRATELKLARQVEAQLAELRDAYRTLAERNDALDATLRKAKMAQAVAAVAVLAVFGGLGAWAWRSDSDPGLELRPAGVAADAEAGERRIWTVHARPLRLTTAVIGRIAPGTVSNVLSPVGGTVRAVHVHDGEEVEAGRILLALDASTELRRLRAAKAKVIEAAQRLEDLEAWETGRAMTTARGRTRRAAGALERQRRRVEQTAFLMAEGVIASGEHEAAVEQMDWVREDYETALSEIDVIRAQGGAHAKETAMLEYRNLVEEEADLKAAIEAATVRAPVAGMVIAMSPASGREGRDAGAGADLMAGARVADGDLLLRIADVGTLSVTGEVSEIEVTALRVGQAVRVTGSAFPVALDGRLSHVAAHGEPGAGGTRFAIRADIGMIEAGARATLRIGMSAEMTIVVRDAPSAIVVPITALKRMESSYFVDVASPGQGTVRRVAVETGTTTADGVEIVRGVDVGDRLVLPGGGGAP